MSETWDFISLIEVALHALRACVHPALARTSLNATTFYPSSIGLSFCVDGEATDLQVKAGWGSYHREQSETFPTPSGKPKMVWKRQPMGGEKRISLAVGPIESWSPEAEEQPDVVVRGLVRRSNDAWIVTLFLVNEQREPETRRDSAWIFQPELVVKSPDDEPIFRQRPTLKRRKQTSEEQAMSMLYRNHASFAMGHGISVHAETVKGDPTRALRLSTCVYPSDAPPPGHNRRSLW